MQSAVVVSGRRPRLVVIGARGRVGLGAVKFAREQLGLEVAEWDKEQTAAGGPFPQLLEYGMMC